LLPRCGGEAWSVEECLARDPLGMQVCKLGTT
jgi:hypothetical protein